MIAKTMFSVSLLLTAATPDRDGQVRNPICHLTVAVRGGLLSPRRPPHPVVKSRHMDSGNQIVPNDSVICDTNYKYEFSPEMSMQSALSQPDPAGTGI